MKKRKQSDTKAKTNPQQNTAKDKKNKKDSIVLIIACLIIGISTGWLTKHGVKDFIDNIFSYKIAIVKKDEKQKQKSEQPSLSEDVLNKEQNQNSTKETK